MTIKVMPVLFNPSLVCDVRFYVLREVSLYQGTQTQLRQFGNRR